MYVKAHVRGAKRRAGGGYGRGVSPLPREFLFEDILETAQFGGTLPMQDRSGETSRGGGVMGGPQIPNP